MMPVPGGSSTDLVYGFEIKFHLPFHPLVLVLTIFIRFHLHFNTYKITSAKLSYRVQFHDFFCLDKFTTIIGLTEYFPLCDV